jgi:hypothetical protein
MLSERSVLPFELPLRPSFCLNYYLFSAHVLSLQLLLAVDWEDMGVSLFLIALLLTHYYCCLRNEPSRRFAALTYRSLTGWQLIEAGDSPVSVTPVSARWLTSRWVLVHFLSESITKTPLVLVLCPDVLNDRQARQLKQYLILYGRHGKENRRIFVSGDTERF